MRHSTLTRYALVVYGIVCLAFLYLPLVAVAFASVSKARYLTFPIKRYTFDWYREAAVSATVADLVWISFKIAAVVTVVAMVIGFFGALAFARYRWRFRRSFQKLILLPIFFPQAVLGLALLLWFNGLGVIPSWKTAIVAHLVWIAPIATLIIAIRAYSFDPALEEAARDMGASTWQVLTEITLPLLWPGVLAAGLFAFLLSWGNFPLSLFTTGADQTLPEWLYAKMVSGYSPLVPTVGTASFVVSTILIVLVILIGPRLVRRRSVLQAGRSIKQVPSQQEGFHADVDQGQVGYRDGGEQGYRQGYRARLRGAGRESPRRSAPRRAG
jgi:spermidine/putrescine transport system permease protein